MIIVEQMTRVQMLMDHLRAVAELERGASFAHALEDLDVLAFHAAGVERRVVDRPTLHERVVAVRDKVMERLRCVNKQRGG